MKSLILEDIKCKPTKVTYEVVSETWYVPNDDLRVALARAVSNPIRTQRDYRALARKAFKVTPI